MHPQSDGVVERYNRTLVSQLAAFIENVVLDRISDVVYRIQRGPRERPKVFHRNRLWTNRGTTRGYWLEDQPGERQETEPERGVPQKTLMSNAGAKARCNRRRVRGRPPGSSPKNPPSQ